MSCDVNFDTKSEAFLDELEALGGFSKATFKTTYSKIGQVNADANYNFDQLIDEIKATFTPSQWANAFTMIVDKSFAVFCNEDAIFLGSVNAIIAKVNE